MSAVVSRGWDGFRLRQLRYTLGLSQSQLAKSLSVSGSYLSMIENGARKPSEPLLQLLCLVYGVNKQWLESGQGKMFLGLAEADHLTRPTKQPVPYDRNSLKEVIYFVVQATAQEEKPLFTTAQIELILDLYERAKIAAPEEEISAHNFFCELP